MRSMSPTEVGRVTPCAVQRSETARNLRENVWLRRARSDAPYLFMVRPFEQHARKETLAKFERSSPSHCATIQLSILEFHVSLKLGVWLSLLDPGPRAGLPSKPARRDGRVAEGGGLLNRCTVKSRTGGSNPPLSARFFPLRFFILILIFLLILP